MRRDYHERMDFPEKAGVYALCQRIADFSIDARDAVAAL